jgi:sialate O-acetylesterase
MNQNRIISLVIFLVAACAGIASAAPLKLHAVFSDHMVIQRDKPIKVWGWAQPGQTIYVKFGEETAEAKAGPTAPVQVANISEQYAGLGPWEVTFPAREANVEPTTLQVTNRQDMLTVEDILIGDVWVLYGQSNMAWPMGKSTGSDIARAQADRPLLREFKIKGNEQATLQDDIRPDAVEHGGWLVSTPESAGNFSGIGYHFGAGLQQALGIPVGLINAARGGAAIESMVPARKFSEDPIAKRYAEHVEQRMAEFDHRARALASWERQLARAKGKNQPEAEWPKKPEGHENLRSWDIPGMSPSDRASIYNGMFGVLKGLNINGVLFHQGYNNATAQGARPQRYRVLTRLMIEGIREDFNEPDLAFGIIGFCAGANSQNVDNFETESIDAAPYIREAQRLGLADVENQTNLMFIPGYDVIVPGLHPSKKREHGERALRWALANIYPDTRIQWRDTEMISCEPVGDMFVLKFEGAIICDTRNSIPEGFSLAGEDGKFYMAHARYIDGRGHPQNFPNEIYVWSPLVPNPVALRYAWARSPMGNLKMRGNPDRPFPSFRTDDWHWPESEDPAESLIGRGEWNQIKAEAEERLEFRRTEEAKRGLEVLERIQRLGKDS